MGAPLPAPGWVGIRGHEDFFRVVRLILSLGVGRMVAIGFEAGSIGDGGLGEVWEDVL
jgi:hypothetical protein